MKGRARVRRGRGFRCSTHILKPYGVKVLDDVYVVEDVYSWWHEGANRPATEVENPWW